MHNSNRYQTQIFHTQRSLTDYQRQERSWWTRLAVGALLALLLVGGLGLAGTWEVENYQVRNGLEVR